MLFVAVFALLAGPACARSAAVGAEELYAIPKGMLIGAGTSAIQTEGAWDQDGKGVSHTDYLLHLGKLGALFFGDPHAHDTAADSYHRYKEDVAMAAALKLKLYRFSFSWSRLLPTGDASKPNPKGVEFYNNLINEILSHDMVPMATLYHFDHPQNFEEEFKGWQGEQMVDKFEEYSRFVFKEFSDRVKLWNTINEANMYCTYFPSLFVESELYTKEEADVYQCLRHTILGHAKAYRAFKEGGYDGKVGFSALLMHARPNSTLPEDILAADTFNEMHAGTSLHPVVFGDYPEVVKELLGARLTPFTEQEKQLVKGTSDFFGFNVYYGMRATWQDPDTPPDEFAKIPVLGQFVDDIPYLRLSVNGVDATNIIEMFSLIEPDAIRSAVIWAWETYKVPMVISENGYGDSFGLGIHDERRAVYHSAFLRTLVSTIKTFKIDVMGYAAWSLIDSFEWSGAYSRPFGLVHVDYEGGTLKRTLKDSASFWVELGNTGVVPLVEMSSTTPQSTSAPKQTTAIPVSSSTTKQGGGPSGAGSAAASSILLLLMSLFALLRE